MRIGNLSGRLSLFTGEGAVDVERASSGQFGPDPQAVYARWDEFRAWAQAGAATAEAAPFSFADLGAPVPRPSQVFGIGVNYRTHAAEGGVDLPASLMVFTKFVSSLTGPAGQITLAGPTVDWEVELVAVIGRPAYRVSRDRGWDYIAGLTVGQDLSERTTLMRGPFPQLNLGKSFPGFGPTGPWLVTPDEFGDPDDLALSCAVNGKTMQEARTSELVNPVAALVAELSAVLPLAPGDVIFTGTPGGVGMARKPPVFLRPGDELVSEIEGIGAMRHQFVSA
jgi:2-keto-4-pentenoate hydratase/2-oxohepta-3-ene-1,7-dioic acid hydratase in catechol pathway